MNAQCLLASALSSVFSSLPKKPARSVSHDRFSSFSEESIEFRHPSEVETAPEELPPARPRKLSAFRSKHIYNSPPSSKIQHQIVVSPSIIIDVNRDLEAPQAKNKPVNLTRVSFSKTVLNEKSFPTPATPNKSFFQIPSVKTAGYFNNFKRSISASPTKYDKVSTNKPLNKVFPQKTDTISKSQFTNYAEISPSKQHDSAYSKQVYIDTPVKTKAFSFKRSVPPINHFLQKKTFMEKQLTSTGETPKTPEKADENVPGITLITPTGSIRKLVPTKPTI